MNDRGGAVLECRGVTKRFREGKLAVDVLKGIDLRVSRGESVAVIGASGAGKSTLLHILGGLARPSSGEVLLNGHDVFALGEKARGALRNHALGFVYQFHHLLPEFSALENVAMPLLIRREKTRRAFEAAAEMLSRVGLSHRLDHKPGELSGGERQRTAIARALVTGNLDSGSAAKVFEVMLEMSMSRGTALILVTHDRSLSARLERTLEIIDGMLLDPETRGVA
jgi:lipoprotein-releasing system ATP-binding protein